MKYFTEKEVLLEIKHLLPPVTTRERAYIDKRNYIIALLFYKFDYTEKEISDIFKLTTFRLSRPSVSIAKRQAGMYIKENNARFLRNIGDLYKKFPYDVPETIVNGIDAHLNTPISLKCNKRLEVYSRKYSITKNQAVRKLLEAGLKIDESGYKVKLVRS